MAATSQTFRELVQELLTLREHTFPLVCPRCQKTYPSFDAFLSRTVRDISGPQSISAAGPELDQNPVVSVFRDCVCGETLVALFQDRRDTSANGLRQREVFGQLLEMLEGAGLSPSDARAEVIKLLHGQASAVVALFEP